MAISENLTHIENKNIQKELKGFGNTLWIGAPLTVLRDTLINPNNSENIPFTIAPDNIPFNGNISAETLRLALELHIRSRWAHVALDIGKELIGQVINGVGDKEIPKEGFGIMLRMVNHGSRPLLLQKEDRPFHFFITPNEARITGDELIDLMSTDNEDGIFPFGEEGNHWRKHYEKKNDGNFLFSGIYLRIDEKERYWIPDSSASIIIPNYPTFNDVRTFLFENYFKKSNDRDFIMPSNHLWIGKLLPLQIGKGKYAKLDNNAFVDINGKFFRKGLQTHSPLLDGRTVSHHVEVKGPADWVLVNFIRAGKELKAG